MGALPTKKVIATKIALERDRKNLARKRKAERTRRGSGFFRDVPESEVEELWERITEKYGLRDKGGDEPPCES